MATRGIVPRANGEGSIGTEKKHWEKGFFRDLFVDGKAILDFVKGLGIESTQVGTNMGWIKFGNGTLIQWLHAPGNKDFTAPIEFKEFDAGFCTGNTLQPEGTSLVYKPDVKKFYISKNTATTFWFYTLLIGRWK